MFTRTKETSWALSFSEHPDEFGCESEKTNQSERILLNDHWPVNTKAYLQIWRNRNESCEWRRSVLSLCVCVCICFLFFCFVLFLYPCVTALFKFHDDSWSKIHLFINRAYEGKNDILMVVACVWSWIIINWKPITVMKNLKENRFYGAIKYKFSLMNWWRFD